MPFDFAAYKRKCDALTTEELQVEWQNYTRQLTSGATLTASSVLLSPLTSGISLLGMGFSVPQIHNARKKRAIVGNKMQLHGKEPRTRLRDVIIPAGISVTASGLTFGLTPPGAELLGGEAGARGIEYVVTHVTLDAIWAIFDEAQNSYHHKRSVRKIKRLQDQRRQDLAKDAVKPDEYSKPGLDIKRPFLQEENKNSRPVRRSLRPYYIEEDDYFYDRDQTPPPAYSKKYVYHAGKVQYSYEAQPDSSHLSPYIQTPRMRHRRRNYDNTGPAIENLGLLRSSTASRRSLIHENSHSAISSPAGSRPGTSNYSRNNLKSYNQHEDSSEEESDLESEDGLSDLEEDNEAEDDTENESDEDNNELEDAKKKDGKVIEHVLTLEQEINMLKATILRMEMEKRGLQTDT